MTGFGRVAMGLTGFYHVLLIFSGFSFHLSCFFLNIFFKNIFGVFFFFFPFFILFLGDVRLGRKLATALELYQRKTSNLVNFRSIEQPNDWKDVSCEWLQVAMSRSANEGRRRPETAIECDDDGV